MTRAERNIAWIEDTLVIPSGSKTGQPFILAAFQKDFLKKIYDNETPVRLAAMSLPRKNGKTTLMAIIGLLHLVGPEAKSNGKIIATAATRSLAAVHVWTAIEIVAKSPKINNLIDVVKSKSLLRCARNNSTYDVRTWKDITSMEPCDHPDVLLCEEAGMIRANMPVFKSSLVVAISTNGRVGLNAFESLHDQMSAVPDESAFSELRCPDDIGWRSDEALLISNPAIGDFVNWEVLSAMRDEAIEMECREKSFRSLVLNQSMKVVLGTE